jgi:hypothetical protein
MRMPAAAVLLAIAVMVGGCLGSGPGNGTVGQPPDGGHGTGRPTAANGTLPPADVGNQSAAFSPPRNWTAPDSASIRPGASLDQGDCTANFVFTSPDNQTVYIGTAAHCFSTSGNTVTNGCQATSKPLGSTMNVEGASQSARLVYSSWVWMKDNHESDAGACAYNDLAILALDPADYEKVSPAMKTYGGPVGIVSTLSTGQKVLTYGNSGSRPSDSGLSPKEGWVVSSDASGWTMSISTATPGIPGDSGSGVLSGNGYAAGVLVTIQATGTNGVSMLGKELDYARGTAGFDVRLATWPQISGGILPPL